MLTPVRPCLPVLLVSLVAFACLPARAIDLPIALAGDTAPDTGGGTYSFFTTNPQVNASGELAFVSAVTGGTASSGVFVGSPSAADRKVALLGETAPGTGGGTFSFLSRPSINDSGDVSFTASVSGGTTGSGIFVDSGGSITAVVVAGDTAPGTGGGVFTSFGLSDMNDSGEIAFLGVVGGTDPAIYVSTAGVLTLVALDGDAAPGVAGGIFEAFGNPGINASGDVVFQGDVDAGATFTFGIFQDVAAVTSLVALEGESAPGTGGGMYDGFPFDAPAIDSSGRVAFAADVGGSSVLEGHFASALGVDSAIALQGDPAPDSGAGATYGEAAQWPTSNDAGTAAFRAVVSGGAVAQGVYVDSAGVDSAVALEGSTAPGTGGGTYSGFFFRPAINAGGEVAFGAFVTGGTTGGGFFLPEPGSQVSLLAGGALVALLARRRRSFFSLRSASAR